MASVRKLEEENKTLKAAAEVAGHEISELKKQYAKWETKCTTQASAFEQEKKNLHEKVIQLLKKKAALEQYIEDFSEEMNAKLAGRTFGRVNPACFRILASVDSCVVSVDRILPQHGAGG